LMELILSLSYNTSTITMNIN
uniref:Uncharacterized protein n=1 Tax=Amphimedon queenslandica TaxID=400682 RepID=A0A1X7SIS0_AMPQE